MSSPPPESGHGKQAEASPGSAHGKEAEEVVPVKAEAAAAAAAAGGQKDGAHINIKITSQTAPDVFIRVRRDVSMESIMCKYCAKHSLNPKAVLFLNEEGKHLRAAQTVEEAGLEEGSTIDVHLSQQGGSGRSSV